ncbi:MAG TPA: translesion error-prone DNA polymerase V autoproteolytic subunit [Candidatus Saccharimonadales bacterium]|nr:translesion error-prone DNA polymerase V autoproteolytic subunit [Candidatus Saccharimonadales bacterium]
MHIKKLSAHLQILATSDHELPKLQLPFSEDKISAGFPSSAENFTEKSLDLNELLIHHPTSTFYVKVIGDSMSSKIATGDILIVDRSLQATNNKIVIARVNDEFLVKRIKFEGKKIFLIPDNSMYKVIEITEEMDFEIWGVVTCVIHQV